MGLSIFHPHRPFLRAWNATILLFVFVNAVIVPLHMVFSHASLVMAYWLTTVVFLADIGVSFNAAIVRGAITIDRRADIASRYLRGWFAVDLVAALPFTMVAGAFSGLAPVSLVVNCALMLRLIKTARLPSLLGGAQKEFSFNPAIMRLVSFFFLVTIVVHWMSLGWIAIGALGRSDDRLNQYLQALYWVMTTVATIGYGDITPDKTNNLQLIYTIVVEFLGVMIYGYVIGNMAALMANLDVAKANYLKKMEEINAFLRRKKIPLPLQKKIQGYFHYLWDSRAAVDDTLVLDELPPSLGLEVSLFLNRDILRKVPMFKNASEIFIREVVKLIQLMVFLPGDAIVRADEYGDCMYFINTGSVSVVGRNGATIVTLAEGSFFGEMSLIRGEKRNASIIAQNYCDVYRLSKDDFDRLLAKYPEFNEQVQLIVQKRSQPSSSDSE